MSLEKTLGGSHIYIRRPAPAVRPLAENIAP